MLKPAGHWSITRGCFRCETLTPRSYFYTKKIFVTYLFATYLYFRFLKNMLSYDSYGTILYFV